MPVNVTAKFSLPKFGTKQVAKKPAKKAGTVVKKAATTIKKAAPVGTGTRSGGVGYRKYEGDALWLPNTTRPAWLDGSLPGNSFYKLVFCHCVGAAANALSLTILDL
jgi:hypothetical protein